MYNRSVVFNSPIAKHNAGGYNLKVGKGRTVGPSHAMICQQRPRAEC